MAAAALSDANAELGIPPEHPTIASLLKANGYETGLVGKWHVGNAPQYNPTKHGYEEFFGIVGAGQDYFTHKNTAAVMDLFENDKPVERDGYLTDLFTERGVQFIRRKHTRPFYLSIHYNALALAGSQRIGRTRAVSLAPSGCGLAQFPIRQDIMSTRASGPTVLRHPIGRS